MYNIDFKKTVHVYFMGIGGISMSGLAQILIEENFKVSGSDNKESEMTSALEKKGVKRRGSVGEPVKGEVTVKFLRPMKYHIRYESQVTSRWATFTYDASSPDVEQVTLNY